jgi:hypothetical protein
VVSFTSRMFYPRGKIPRYQLHRSWVKRKTKREITLLDRIRTRKPRQYGLLSFHKTTVFIRLFSTSIAVELHTIFFCMKIIYLCMRVALLILRYLFCNYSMNRLFTDEIGYFKFYIMRVKGKKKRKTPSSFDEKNRLNYLFWVTPLTKL